MAHPLSLIVGSSSTPISTYLRWLRIPRRRKTVACPSSIKFVGPCIHTTAKAIPRGDAWLHEPKLDGYRFQIVKDGRQVRL
jgi:ATP-dependent DNA ligase